MKTLNFSLLPYIFLLCFSLGAEGNSNSATPNAESSSEASKEESFDLNFSGKTYKITLGRATGKEVAFIVRENGRQIQKNTDLGAQFGFFEQNGMKVRTIVHDFSGDGIPEFALRTTQPPLIGSLWVYRWNGSKFVVVRGPRGDGYFPVPLESNIQFTEEKEFQFSLGGTQNILRWEKGTFILKKSRNP